MFAQTNSDDLFSRLTGPFKRRAFKRNRRSLIVISAMPKSASQHFITAFSRAFADDYQVIRGKLTIGSGNNFLSEKAIAQSLPSGRNVAVYGHVPMTTYNESVVARFGRSRKAIVTIRNLPDTIFSYKDHIDRHGFGPIDPRIGSLPEGTANWSQFGDEQKLSYLVTFVVPWYVQFISSWLEAADQGWNVLFSPFEEHTGQTELAMQAVARRFELSASRIPEAEATAKVNFNVGVGGRGLSQLNPELSARIHQQLEMALDIPGNATLFRYLVSGYDHSLLEARDTPMLAMQQETLKSDLFAGPVENENVRRAA